MTERAGRVVRTAYFLAVALTLIACRGGVSPSTYLDAVYEGDTEAVAASLDAGIAVDTELVGVEFQNLVRRRASVKTA